MAVQKITPNVPTDSHQHVDTKLRDAKKIRAAALAGVDQAEFVGSTAINVDVRGDVLVTARFSSKNPDDLVGEITGLWRRAQEEFLAIGRCLISARGLIEIEIAADLAKRSLTPAERRRLIEARWGEFVDRLPFKLSIASQLTQVARALDDGRLKRNELPSTYSVAYQLTTLSDAELEAARRQGGIVDPSATRARVIDFKRRIRSLGSDERQHLQRRRERVLQGLKRLSEELAKLEDQLGIQTEE
jgi:hypothetical protein